MGTALHAGCNFALSFRTNLLFAFWETYVLKGTETVPEAPIYPHVQIRQTEITGGNYQFFCILPFFGQFGVKKRFACRELVKKSATLHLQAKISVF